MHMIVLKHDMIKVNKIWNVDFVGAVVNGDNFLFVQV